MSCSPHSSHSSHSSHTAAARDAAPRRPSPRGDAGRGDPAIHPPAICHGRALLTSLTEGCQEGPAVTDGWVGDVGDGPAGATATL
eukprot:gene16004-biopygen2211